MALQLDFDSFWARSATRVEEPVAAPPAPPEFDEGAETETEASASSEETALAFADRLSRLLDEPVRLVVTNNRNVMLSARRRDGFLVVRVHRMFLRCPPEVAEAVGFYLGGRSTRAGNLIDAFIKQNREHIDRSPRRQRTLRSRGEVHDLLPHLKSLATRYFEAPFEVEITWGRRTSPRRRKRSIQLGTYVPAEKLIRIHPVLDQDWVPVHYLESVLHHEMLHHHLGAEVRGGRLHFHTPEFRALERAFEQHELASAWEKKNLARLLRS